MSQWNAYALLLATIFAIDICARWSMSSYAHAKSKPAGLLPLIILSFTQGARYYAQRDKVIKQFFLSLLIVIALLVADELLVTLGVPQSPNVLGYALLVTPILTLPFFHFLYGLIGLQPLFVDELLIEFRLRGAIAIIFAANIIFVAIEPVQHVIALFIHFSLAFIALLGSFFLCSHRQRRASNYHAPFQYISYGIEPMLLYYLATILEVFYYLMLIIHTFVVTSVELWLKQSHALIISLSLFGLLTLVTLLTKIRFLFGSLISLEFYEERALPLSFLLFGIISIVRYYF